MTAKGKITGSSASFTGDLKVTGQIKGKIWHSTEYEAEFEYIMQPNGAVMSKEEKKEVKMLPCKNSVAFLTSICGQFNGDGERVWIEKREEKGEEYWYLCCTSKANPGYIKAKAICIGTDE
jgi:hypothetical protein